MQGKGRPGALILALSWLMVGSACTQDAAPAKNLILISIDTLVPGRMSLYGGPRKTTPHLDSLARRSVRFDNAFTPAPWTLPAHASMLSGLYPSTLHARPGRGFSLSRATLLAQRFQRHGHRTGAVTGGGFMSKRFGAARGFDWFRTADAKAPRNTVVDSAIEWLSAERQEPFFFFLHTYIVHSPYLDQRYVAPGEGGRMRDFFDQERPGGHFCCQDKNVTRDEREFMLALYDGGVAAADELVAELLNGLERLQLLDDTAIIITSDHGEEFWGHTSRGGHGHSLYDDQLRVPILWYEPRLPAAGTAVHQPVSLIDIVPTIVARFGLSAEDTFDGVDLSPLLDLGDWHVARPLYAEATQFGPERWSVRTEEAKLILTPSPDARPIRGARDTGFVAAPRELFLTGDSEESRNLGESPAEAALLTKLDRLLSEYRGPEGGHRFTDYRLFESLKKQGAARAAKQSPQDAKMRRQLQGLGYIE